MIVTVHGKKDPLFKGVARHNGTNLVFFGWSLKHVKLKESQWLEQNAPVAESREKQRPQLRLVVGGKQQSRAD